MRPTTPITVGRAHSLQRQLVRIKTARAEAGSAAIVGFAISIDSAVPIVEHISAQASGQ